MKHQERWPRRNKIRAEIEWTARKRGEKGDIDE